MIGRYAPGYGSLNNSQALSSAGGGHRSVGTRFVACIRLGNADVYSLDEGVRREDTLDLEETTVDQDWSRGQEGQG